MKNLLLTTILILSSVNLFAQGTPHVKIFSNFNFDMDSEPENASKGFEIKRAYLGYKYNLSDDFSTKITFDVGKLSLIHI